MCAFERVPLNSSLCAVDESIAREDISDKAFNSLVLLCVASLCLYPNFTQMENYSVVKDAAYAGEAGEKVRPVVPPQEFTVEELVARCERVQNALRRVSRS